VTTKASASQCDDIRPDDIRPDHRKPERGSAARTSVARQSARLGGKADAKPEADARARRYDPAETRIRVLEAAYKLFGTRGYAATGTADIAREAGCFGRFVFSIISARSARFVVELGRLHGQRMIDYMQADDDSGIALLSK